MDGGRVLRPGRPALRPLRCPRHAAGVHRGLSRSLTIGPAFYLFVGSPGTGEDAVAQALAHELRARGTDPVVVDNQYVNNPVLGVLHLDGVTPLPGGVWPLVGLVRNAVLTAAEQFAPRSRSFILTNDIA